MAGKIYRWHGRNSFWSKFFWNPNLKLFCSRVLVSIWLLESLISLATAEDRTGSRFNLILLLLLMSPLRDLCFVLALWYKSTKFTRFTSFDGSLPKLWGFSYPIESSWILFCSSLLASLISVFWRMNSLASAFLKIFSFGSSTNSIS